MATALTTPKTALLRHPQRPKSTMRMALVSPRMAETILTFQRYPGQRLLREHHVAYLDQLMEHGHFQQDTVLAVAEVPATATTEAQSYLVNGYHRLTALARRRGPSQWFWLSTLRVANMDEVRALYRTYDRGLARSLTDLYGSEAAQDPTASPRTHFKLLGSAVLPLAAGFAQEFGFDRLAGRNLLRDSALRFALMEDWRPELQAALADIQGPRSIRDELIKANTLSIILVTYRFQPLHAGAFWPAIAKDSGLMEGMPAHALLRYLREHQVHKVGPALFQRHIAAAWNASVEGKPLKQVRTPMKATDAMLLAGTPHDGTSTKRYLLPDGTIVHTPQAIAP